MATKPSAWQHFTAGHWLALIVTATLIYLSLNLGALQPEYRVRISPAASQEGSVTVALYGNEFDSYLSRGILTVPASGWQIIRGADSTVLSAQAPAAPLEIVARNTPVNLTFVHHAKGGSATVDNGAGDQRLISLRADQETLSTLVIGGANSSFAASAEAPRFGVTTRIFAAMAILILLTAITWQMTRPARADESPRPRPRRIEIVFSALPFLITSGVTLIAFLPGNVSYDGSLQWAQAAGRGELFEPLGYPTTYLMRAFASMSSSPLPLIAIQVVLAAFGMALVLRELRHRGLSLPASLGVATALAITPQYFTFFTNLGKDPLCLTGILFFVWALLNLFRQPRNALPSWGMLTALVVSGLFAGLMRNNVMPIILVALAAALALLFWRRRAYRLIGTGVVFLVVALVIPKSLATLAAQEVEQYQRPAERVRILPNADLPLGVFTNLYLYHLFSAAMANDIAVTDDEARPFFAIIPQEKWKNYSCYMTDTTMASLGQNIRFTQSEYNAHLQAHQPAMAQTVLRIIRDNPALLLERQACITRVLWQIGVGDRPFQATAMLGYDIVDKRFPPLAGESRTPWPSLRQHIQDYVLWAESPGRFWFFWKPALPLAFGLFIVGLYLVRTRDIGVMVVALLPVLTIVQLLLVIPFPAYRYAYPAVLVMMLLSGLVFRRPNPPGTRTNVLK
ncbi:hypothetical protein [Achromobacter spanius]|uniref:hypothetical protein n=1 Tax=Achromobacter spanius TaxID=217203 RepID=UPI003824EE8C